MAIKNRLTAATHQGAKPKAGAAAAASDQDDKDLAEEEDEAAAADDEPEDGKAAQAKTKSKAKSKTKAKGAEDPDGDESDEAGAEGEDDEEEMSAAAADPGIVAQLCADAAVPNMAKALIDARLPLRKVKGRIGAAAAIRGACAVAGRICRTVDPKMADAFIANGASLAHVKAELFDMVVKAQGPEIRNSHAQGSRPADGGAEQSGNYGWDKTIESINAKRA